MVSIGLDTQAWSFWGLCSAQVALSLRALDEMGGGVASELQLGSWPLVRTRTYKRKPGRVLTSNSICMLDISVTHVSPFSEV